MIVLAVGILLCAALVVPQAYVCEMKENVMVPKDTAIAQESSRILLDFVRYLFEYIFHNFKSGILPPLPPPHTHTRSDE